MFADFLGGARDRLLPPSVPFRFFGAALLFHGAAWALLLAYASGLPGYQGGAGPILAALHLITLGVLAMTAIGAAFQLLPVATRKPPRSVMACKATFWLFLAGLIVLFHGMGAQANLPMEVGGALAAAGLALFAVLVVDSARGVADMRLVLGHVRASMACLIVVLVLGLLLIFDFRWGFLEDRRAFALAHAVLAAFGFMGLLAFGFSFVLMPMFALARPAAERPGRVSLALALAGLAACLAGLFQGGEILLPLAVILAIGAAGFHLAAMARLLQGRMRKSLGGSFFLIRLGWGLLPVALTAGLAAATGLGEGWSGTLFGFLLVAGWLLTFLTGVLQRIIPFLASMHSVAPGVKPILVSKLTARHPLLVHLVCHPAALLAVSAGIVTGRVPLIRIGAAFGLIGAIALAWFAAMAYLRLQRHLALIA